MPVPPPDVAALQDDARFTRVAEIQHNDIAGFVSTYYLKRHSVVTVAHILLSLAALAVWVLSAAGASLDAWLTSLGVAALALLPIIPLHEGLHAVTYRAFGARDVRFGGSLRTLVVYAVAHNFVADARAFTWVALMPFLVINTLLALGALVFPAARAVFLGALLMHISSTSGDFALLNFFWLNRRRELFTYDDADRKVSYIYARVEPPAG